MTYPSLMEYQNGYLAYPIKTDWYPPYYIHRNRMTIEGLGSVKAMPGIAEISLGVITENEKLEVAQEQNAIKANRVISALLSINISREDIKSYSYSIEQIYEYIDGKRVFQGYKVTNRISVGIKDMERIGEVIDIAVKSGANTVYNVDFKVSEPSIYYRKALTKAVDNAIQKARDIGIVLGTDINRIPIKIVEENYESYYTPMQPAFRAPEVDTPIIAGEIEIGARIKAIFTY